jgi:hypothetical protein
MTNKEKIELVNRLLIEVKTDECNEENYNESSFRFLEHTPSCLVVDYWYNHLEPQIFVSEKTGLEIDEHLNVEEYRF